MLTYNTVITHSDENLRFIGEHKRAFDIENLYLLDLFEEFVQMHKWGCGIACCCNIDTDRLYPARFYLTFDQVGLHKEYVLPYLNATLRFLQRLEGRPGVKINYQLLQQFLSTGLDSSKVKGMSLGVDARTEPTDSRLKLFISIENYPEKVANAIALCGENRDWPTLLVNKELLIGFDFFLNGRAAVEVYPTFNQEDLQRVDVQVQLRNILPARALPLLDRSKWFQIGISDANESDVLYFNSVFDPNSFVDNLDNQMAKRVHAYYRHQPLKFLYVGIPESEFSAWSIQNMKMYYHMTDFRI